MIRLRVTKTRVRNLYSFLYLRPLILSCSPTAHLSYLNSEKKFDAHASMTNLMDGIPAARFPEASMTTAPTVPCPSDLPSPSYIHNSSSSINRIIF